MFDLEPHETNREAETSVKRYRLTLWVAMLGLTLAAVFANYTEIDQVTQSTGRVIASGKTQVVQASDGGIIRRLMVTEGQLVEQGQLLGTLEKTRAQAAVDDSRAKVAALKITLTRLKSEIFNQPLVFDTDLQSFPELIENQRNLYTKRRTALEEDIAALNAVKRVAQKELELNTKLLQTGDVGQSDVLRLTRLIAETDVQIITKRNKFMQDAQAEMAKAQEDLNAQSEALTDRTQVLEQTNLVSPARGYVKNINITTLGGVVRPGDVLMELFPVDDRLIIEAKVMPMDIAFVGVGQPARIKLDAFDASIYGAFSGSVSYLSPDTLSENTADGPVFYYRINVEVGEKDFRGAKSDALKLVPGMSVQVDILAGKRTLLSYITNPVSKVLDNSLKAL